MTYKVGDLVHLQHPPNGIGKIISMDKSGLYAQVTLLSYRFEGEVGNIPLYAQLVNNPKLHLDRCLDSQHILGLVETFKEDTEIIL